MAKTDAILRADRSTATSAALALLCLLGAVQAGLLFQAAWRKWRPTATVEAQAAPVATPAAPTPAANPVPLTVPNLPALPALPVAPGNGLPPLPSAGGSLPPLPALPAVSPPGAMKPATPVAPVAPVSAIAPAPALPASRSTMLAPAPVPSKTINPTLPKTGNASVDELIEVAAQSRELNDAEGALQALERADLMLPDNPVVLREKALTLGRLGRADKAQALWDKVARLGPGAGATSAPSAMAASNPAPGSLNEAFASLGASTSGPLSLGPCEVVRDASVIRGQQMLLRVPVKGAAGSAIGVNDWNLDVLFYDRVDGSRLEPTNADPVALNFDLPVDFKTGEEIVTAVYHMPELTPQEIANIGRREFGGYVIKLYYKNRLMSTAASPRDLLSGSNGANTGAAPVANPLLPPLQK